MKITARFLLALPLLFSVSHPALAAATQEEATRLTELFQSYLGAEEGVVAVEPNGDDYALTIDVAPLAAKAKDPAFTFSLTPIELSLTDKGDGKWDVSQNSPMEFKLKSGTALEANVKIENYTWEGVFDESLGSFASASGEMKNLVVAETVDDPAQGKMNVGATVKSAKIEQTGVAGASGGVDTSTKYLLEGLSETIVTAGNPASNMPPLNVVVTAESGNYEVAGKGFMAKSMLDIIAFFISHQSKDLVIKDQVALKTMLSSALPLFNNLSATSTFNKVSVASPMGPVGMESLTAVVDLNGVVKDGKARESLSVTGLTVPPAIVPPWATTLVPKNMTFDFQASGFDLAAPAALILAAIDFAKDPSLPAGFEATLLPVTLPKGTVDITLNPTSISNDLYTVSAEGTMTAGPSTPIPSGKGTIKFKGIDDVMKVIQAAPPEAGLQAGTPVILLAKGLAKAEADGSLSWLIESAGDGKVLVNGVDATKMK